MKIEYYMREDANLDLDVLREPASQEEANHALERLTLYIGKSLPDPSDALRSAAQKAMLANFKLREQIASEEITQEMIVAGFECDAWDKLSDAVLEKKGWPYSCRESAECVTAIYKAMRAARMHLPTPPTEAV